MKDRTRVSRSVVKRMREFHPKALKLLKSLGFKIVWEKCISNRPYDIIAEKDGLTYYVDLKAPVCACKISVNELKGMRRMSRRGIPVYLFMLPDGGYMFFKFKQFKQ